MIRLLVIAVAAFLLWVVFFSSFSKKHKIWIVIAGMLFSVCAMWLESSWQEPKRDLIQKTDIEVCGTAAKHSYRSSFDISICLDNQSDKGHVKRLGFDVVASTCNEQQECVEIQRVSRNIQVDLTALTKTTVIQNLDFKRVSPSALTTVWNTEITAVRATVK